MNKYEVTFYLMVNPCDGDETFKKSYIVEAETPYKAEVKAEKLKDSDSDNIKYRSVFNVKVRQI